MAPNLLPATVADPAASTRDRTMLAHQIDRVIQKFAPGLVPARTLHHRALAAVGEGRFSDAERLFESAAEAYRRDLCIEPLARLRVHQRLAQARSCGDSALEAERMLDIVRTLNRLDQLESLRQPFALRDARTVLSEWLADGPGETEAPRVDRAA